VLSRLFQCLWVFRSIIRNQTKRLGMNQKHRSDLFQMLYEKSVSRTVEWSHVSDASTRIEAIISGHAVVVATSDQVTVQPETSKSPPTSVCLNVTPIPHIVVVIKGISTQIRRPEKRSRRVGRISRQFVAPDESDCCSLLTFCCTSTCCTHRKQSSLGPLVMC
jgi:hypothetical protein